MGRPDVMRAGTIFLALLVSAFTLPALAQRDFVSIQNIQPRSDLQSESIIAMPTNHSQGQEALQKGTASPFSGTAPASSALSRGRRYPADLQYHGGPVLPSAVHHSIFVNASSNCAPNACWGDPIGFLTDLGQSGMIHVADQYVGASGGNRYSSGTNYVVSGYTSVFGGAAFTNLDIAIIAYSVAAQTNGFGLGDIYHVFLVPGQDLCFDSTYSQCYSPDNGATFAFCGYHSSARDGAGNRVLYTAEPFQNVDGCSVRPDTPNGQLVYSTNNTLSHEAFETITDPRGNAWWNSVDIGVYGEEIGDECSFVTFTATNAYFDPSAVFLNGKQYAVQPEYSNLGHTCLTRLDD